MTRKQQLIPISLMMIAVMAVLAFFTAVSADAASVTFAQSPTVSATITADKETMTVGDPVMLTISVTHPEGSVVLFPELEPTWGDFTVRSQSAAETVSNGDGTALTSQQIDVRLFAPGDFQTLPLPITISDSAGNLTETIAEALPLTVQSVLVEGDTELRDIKPQADLPVPAIWLVVLGGLMVASVVGAFVIWKRRGGKILADNRLPHQKVLDALAHIDKQKYPANGRFKEQYVQVSDILRAYFEASGSVPMTDRTTAEIRTDLVSGQMKAADAERLLLLLEDADMVKFAKVTPSQHEAERVTQDARQLVLDTKPEVSEPKIENRKPKSRKPKSGNGLRVTNHKKQETTI